MKVKITDEKRADMVSMRKKGHTYAQIMKEHGVSKWACMTYLKDIPIDRSWVEKEWRKAEAEAKGILKQKGFSRIINLNEICPSPYWDYYCEKNKEKWLIDVTINTQKSVVDKYAHLVDGYRYAILLKKEEEWDFMEICVKSM